MAFQSYFPILSNRYLCKSFKGYAGNSTDIDQLFRRECDFKGVVGIFCLYLGVFLRASADVLIHAYLPFYFLNHMGETRVWVIGFFLGIPALVRLTVSPFWGRYVARVNHPKIFFAGGLLAYAVFFHRLPGLQNPGEVVVAASSAALFTSIFNPGSRGWLLQNFPLDGLKYLAFWHQWEAAGYLLSSIAIGWVVNNGYMELAQIPPIFGMLLAIGALFTGVFLPKPKRSASHFICSSKMKASKRICTYDKGVIIPYGALGYLLTSSLTWEVVATTFGLYYIGLLGGTMKLYGLLIGSATFVSLFAYGVLAPLCQKRGHYLVFKLASWGYTAMYLLMAYPSVPTASFGYLMPMSSVVRTAINGVVTNQVAETHQGAALGIVDSIEAGSIAWGAILGGMIAHHRGLAFIPKLALFSSVLLHILAPRTKGRW